MAADTAVGEPPATRLLYSVEQAIAELEVFKQTLIQRSREGDNLLPGDGQLSWKNVTIRFVDGHTVSIKVGSESVLKTYQEMGFDHSRSKKPNKQWELLRQFAEEYGTIDWQSKYASNVLKKRKELLSKSLKSYFGISEEPICLNKKRKGWDCVFTILPGG